MNRKIVNIPLPFTPDNFFRLFGEMFSGLSKLENKTWLQAAGPAWAQLKVALKLPLDATVDQCEAAARKVFADFQEAMILNTRNNMARILNQWLASLEGKPDDADIKRLVTVLEIRSQPRTDDPRIIEQRKLDGLCAHGYGFVEYCEDCKALAFDNLIQAAGIAADMWDSNSASVDPEEVNAMLVDALSAAKIFRTGNGHGTKAE